MNNIDIEVLLDFLIRKGRIQEDDFNIIKEEISSELIKGNKIEKEDYIIENYNFVIEGKECSVRSNTNREDKKDEKQMIDNLKKQFELLQSLLFINEINAPTDILLNKENDFMHEIEGNIKKKIDLNIVKLQLSLIKRELCVLKNDFNEGTSSIQNLIKKLSCN